MNILFINPETPDTSWSFKHLTMMFSPKRAATPPLTILTAASMFPSEWEKKLVDLNIEKLRDRHLKWADYVFIYANSDQAESADQLISMCQHGGLRIMAGGAHFTKNFERYNHLDHLILNELELTLPEFIKGYEANWPWRIYRTGEFADLRISPVPDYNILNKRKYLQLAIEYSRAYPMDGENYERTKTPTQVILELDNIYRTGYRGSILFLINNLNNNTNKLKGNLLPAILEWNKIHNKPFRFNTEVSSDISDDKELMNMMREAGFVKVLIGPETSDDELLYDCDKRFVINRNLVLSITNIRNHGLEVSAG